MNRSLSAFVGLTVGAALTAALLVPRADRTALVAQGLSDLLGQGDAQGDLTLHASGQASDGSLAGGPGEEDRRSLFSVLARLARETGARDVALTLQLDGVPTDDPRLLRPFATALDLFDQDRAEPLRLQDDLFVAVCLLSFATGPSWSTMSILLPNVVGLAAAIGQDAGLGAQGDHCSPISDTTVLSSLSSASDHMDHVRTQMPYALVAALVAVLMGYLPTLSLAWWRPGLALVLGAGLLLLVVLVVGRRVPAVSAPPPTEGEPSGAAGRS